MLMSKIFRRFGRVNPVMFVLIILLVIIAILSPAFIQPAGYMNFLKRAAPIAILAIGQLYVITSGGFDLSQGSLVTFTVIGSSVLLNGDPNATYWVIGLMFVIGALVGLTNALIVAYLKVPSIIATLGMMIILTGAALSWSGGAPRGYLPDNFRMFGRLLFTDLPLIRIFPAAVIILIIVSAILWWIMHRTNYGKLLHAVGDNPRASHLSGVRIVKIRCIAFMISSISAVICGILLGGFAGVSTDVGSGLELQAITAAVIGGAQLLGGKGAVGATLAGSLVLQALFTLLNMLGAPKPLRDVMQGLILLLAVAWASYRRKKIRSK